MSEREAVARELYGARLYRAGYVATPKEGETYWESAPLKEKAINRRAAEIAMRAVESDTHDPETGG